MTTERSPRSYAPVTDEHLARLLSLADADHARFTRTSGNKHAWADRRVAVVLAQGAAQHYLDGVTGVKDLDVWTFYAAIPGEPLRCGRYETHADFGPSAHGRQQYPADLHHPKARTWLAYQGRRLDILVRDLSVDPHANPADVTAALQAWLQKGTTARASSKGTHPTPWHLSRKAMIWLGPATPGTIIWPT